MLDAAARAADCSGTAVRYDGNCEGVTVGGTVPATLAPHARRAGQLRRFTPGVAKKYVGATDATVVSTAGDATLTVVDTSANPPAIWSTGRSRSPQPPQAQAQHQRVRRDQRRAADAARRMPRQCPTTSVPIGFKQAIGANDALRTGTYAKTLTFTLSTTNP